MLCHSPLERMICFSFKDFEARQVGWRPVLVVEGGEVEAFVLLESFICDDLRNEVFTRQSHTAIVEVDVP